MRQLFAVSVVLLACTAGARADWLFDELKLRNGMVHRGVIIEETPAEVRFRIVRRAPGKPTFWLTVVYQRKEIDRLTRIGEADRASLLLKLQEIDPTGQIELQRMEKLDIRPVSWLGKTNGAMQYDSEYFSLVSNAPEEVVRRAAVRLDQVYAAYARYLPPRIPGGAPTRIEVHGTIESYRQAIPTGMRFTNPAFYDPSSNRVVCGTDLERLGKDLADFRSEASQLQAELKEQEERVRRLYGKKPELERHLQPLRESRSQIKAAAQTNEKAFDRATRQLFRVLNHEAFHAYVSHFVFPVNIKETGDLPRWLNEGMAQVFETAIFEAGELRIGHADPIRLEQAQDLLNKKGLLPLREMLMAKAPVFMASHNGGRQETDRIYLTTWAMASHLMFDRRILENPEFIDFLKSQDPIVAFEKLVGQPLEEYEKSFHSWLKRLQPDGSLSPKQ